MIFKPCKNQKGSWENQPFYRSLLLHGPCRVVTKCPFECPKREEKRRKVQRRRTFHLDGIGRCVDFFHVRHSVSRFSWNEDPKHERIYRHRKKRRDDHPGRSNKHGPNWHVHLKCIQIVVQEPSKPNLCFKRDGSPFLITLTLLSSEQDIKCWPSGLKSTQRTVPVCALSSVDFPSLDQRCL